MEFSANEIVVLHCSHLREMRGETDEVLRRTRSVEAEKAVLKCVAECGAEPEWFVERWRQGGVLLLPDSSDCGGEGELLAVAAFRGAEAAAKFSAAVAAGGGGDAAVVDDAGLREAMAGVFSAAWDAAHAEQMRDFVAVAEDASGGGLGARIVVGRCGKAAFEGWVSGLAEKWPHDLAGRFGLVYASVADGDEALWAVGGDDAAAVGAEISVLAGLGVEASLARDGKWRGSDELTQMVARVAAKMQSDAKSKADEDEAVATVAGAVEGAVAAKVAAEAAKALG